MNGRLGTLTLATLFAASLLLAGATPARADDDHRKFHRKLDQKHEKYHRKQGNPPYGRALGHRRHHDHDYGRYGGFDGRFDSRFDTRLDRRAYDGRCGHIIDRANKARRGLARWEGTGRHRDAVRAWHEILQKTPRRMAECRARASNDIRRDRFDDRYYDDRYGDRYSDTAYPQYGNSFDIKRDWPFLLGGLLGQYNQ